MPRIECVRSPSGILYPGGIKLICDQWEQSHIHAINFFYCFLIFLTCSLSCNSAILTLSNIARHCHNFFDLNINTSQQNEHCVANTMFIMLCACAVNVHNVKHYETMFSST